MLPAAPARAIAASAVARARVGKSSPDQAPKTGVAALAKPLHSTLPTKKPTAAVAKLKLVAAAGAAGGAVAGTLGPETAGRDPAARVEGAAADSRNTNTMLIPVAGPWTET